ncbi:hypothetical protein [Compostibacter hankyongensis]|uniref:YD repeat-containing protein n=1 Tax=Compostibacter hankyongensis TaxID=1007089 RepID=A0ABP8FZZ8_9BACT
MKRLYKKALLLLFWLPVMLKSADGQSVNSIAPPSPNNSFLGGGGASASPVSVDLYTGTALVNIPVSSLSSRALTIPIGISYKDGRGIKVQDYATCVGLGWQLNAGGGISRVVRGLPDEQYQGYLGQLQWGQEITDAITNGTPIPSEVKGGAGSPPTADGEPDIYYLKTPFFSVQFTFDGNGDPVFSNSTGLKILSTNFYHSYAPDYNNSSFEVIDDKGNHYYFGTTSQSRENTTTKLLGTDYTFPTTWYLDRIVTSNSSDTILFNYTTLNKPDTLYHYRSAITYLYSTNPDDTNPDYTTWLYIIDDPKIITNIISKSGEADFNYIMDRKDDPHAARLSAINLKAYDPLTGSNSHLLSTFNFYYGYFGGSTTDLNFLRLRLDSVSILPTTSPALPLTIASFKYNTNKNLPSRTALKTTDYWGYNSYTGLSNPLNTPIPPVQDYAMANILTEVKDLAGGNYDIYYELNSYYDSTSNSNIQVGGLRVNKISHILPSSQSLSTYYTYTDENGNSSGEILSKAYLIYILDFSCGIHQALSESQTDYYDLNGNFIGYSNVKETNPNGGYTIYNFSNFSTPGCNDIFTYYPDGSYPIPDISSSVSNAFKRGLLLNTAAYDVFGKKVSEDINTYTSLTSPVSKRAWAYKWNYRAGSVDGYTCWFSASSAYWTNVENYRLAQTVHKDYDQNTPTANIQTTVNYTYAPDKRKIRSVTTTNSKGNNHTQTFYYTDDTNIPMITSGEQATLNTMLESNITGIPVHSIENKNGKVHQVHYSYASQPYESSTRTLLAHTKYYTGNTLEKEESYSYDPATSQPISSEQQGGAKTSILYGYKTSMPVAEIRNASYKVDYTSETIDKDTTFYLAAGSEDTKTVNFETFTAGNVEVSFDQLAPYLSVPGGAKVNCTLFLDGYSTGFCISTDPTYNCTSNFRYIHELPAGNHTVSVHPLINTATSEVPIDIIYPSFQTTRTDSTEVFYEGFEEGNTQVTAGNAHTGKAYWDGAVHSAYQVGFSPPNNRKYIIQWWSFSGGKWSMNEQAYTGPRTISGVIDDVRIFPSDAQMTTYTYTPLMGKTSEIDAAGHTTIYEYDGLGRLKLTRDGDRNILSKNLYHYAGQP